MTANLHSEKNLMAVEIATNDLLKMRNKLMDESSYRINVNRIIFKMVTSLNCWRLE